MRPRQCREIGGAQAAVGLERLEPDLARGRRYTVSERHRPGAGHDGAEAADLEDDPAVPGPRSEEHTSELQSLMRSSYAVFCLQKKNFPYNQGKHEPYLAFTITIDATNQIYFKLSSRNTYT